MNKFESMQIERDNINDTNSCGVIALALAADITYRQAYGMLAARGRKHRGSTNINDLISCLQSAGRKVERYTDFKDAKGKRYTPDRFARDFRYGTYICIVHRHGLTVQNGEVLDWTKGRRHRIKEVIRVIS